ncbi:MAG: MFS transporter [Akkermansiaceae bacterium]|jgi:MFS family permease|nr:MFS transporter [Akkermansiaceae bacterium]MDP4645875.1 MFS transporter [Akkermansiaceae bacterium]MDP4720411.1 MFS transporter [Akkermansiaceae bacterium]MDP4779195.1 MFS transporter [Akkermansiaceae bacterium]MDP4848192.1 MFS transporter [Akkermansiaceae bacterium]
MSEEKNMSGNPGRYVWFTTLYNARAYYPILAILFIDLGLTLDQYVMLNMVWAATIFFFEVPSGALADTLGRKTLLVTAAVLMVVEMSCLLFAPKDGGWVLFGLCVANRLLSGLSEAAASGADEALAYDSLPDGKKDDLWDEVLSKAMRYRSVAFVIAMVLGGLMYDPSIVNRLLPESLQISRELAHRLPVAMVLIQGLVCLGITLSMVEPKKVLDEAIWPACKSATKLTLETAKWVFTNPRTRVFVLVGLCIDAVVRNFATITSEYYRLIELPEWSFGFIGSAIGFGGIVVPTIAAWLNKRFSPLANLALIGGMALLGLGGLVPANSWWCLAPAMLLMSMMSFLSFTLSRSLNREADSSKRATVLSVKGLAFNLGYGSFSLAFSGFLASMAGKPEGGAFGAALLWQVPFYAILVGVMLLWGKWLLGRKPL